MDHVKARTTTRLGFSLKLGDRIFLDADFADNLVLMAESMDKTGGSTLHPTRINCKSTTTGQLRQKQDYGP